MINIENLSYFYKTYEKEPGIKGFFRDLFSRRELEFKALDDINIKINKGEMIGLLGPNGAGKTTLIKLMCGILESNAGKLEVLGYNPYKKENSFLKRIGVLLGQKSQLIWDLPPRETLELLKEIYKIDDDNFKNNLNYMMKVLNVTEKLNTPTRKLSLGERVKFEIICTLIHDPEIIFLDEPTIGLDITSQRNIHDFLIELNKNKDVTLIITSHYMKDIEVLCDRIIVIQKGKLKIDSNKRDLINSYSEENFVKVKFIKEVKEFENYYDGDFYIFPIDKWNDISNSITMDRVEEVYKDKKELEEVIFEIFEE